ncbi:GNAT family N-acetyltransferase [Paracoccus sanguinis]|uniref:GNAT family N-acetyltransferase n=1 Tax=Paracoccus sanguinis TaxID=1545044 RepID=UPI0005BA96B3|nr:GNAT family N-acetyltransferase [Paracoccus sanguinis]
MIDAIRGRLWRSRAPVLWQLTPDRAAEWRAIRAAALRDAPLAFALGAGDSEADDSADPLTEARAHLAAVEVWAAGPREGRAQAIAGWQPGWTPGTEDMGWITGVFTAPEARGRGLTALTLGRIAERAAAAGFRRLGLRVGSGNDAARRCYLRAGFQPVGAPFLNERGLPEIEMHRPLPAPAASARRSA